MKKMATNTNTNTIAEGDFRSLNLNENDRMMLEDAYQAVTKSNRWGFLSRPDVPGEGGFMFSQWAQMKEIDLNMEYGGHSGSSYGWTMRQMEYIAKKGWTAFAIAVGSKPPPAEMVTTLLKTAAAVDAVIVEAKEKNVMDPLSFAQVMQSNPQMRAAIPDIDEQVDALKRFQAGKLSYAEMRSLCG